MKETTFGSPSRLGGVVISDRIVASLLEELRSGRYADTTHLPAEVDLAAQMGVSRTVIRDALSEMERAGYIERVRGIGTVVNRAVLNLRSRLDQKLEYYDLIRSFGSYPHADGIQVSSLRAGEDMARSLEIRPGDEILCVKKRLAVHPDHAPVRPLKKVETAQKGSLPASRRTDQRQYLSFFQRKADIFQHFRISKTFAYMLYF